MKSIHSGGYVQLVQRCNIKGLSKQFSELRVAQQTI